MPIEFYRTIGQGEVRAKYLNLTDDNRPRNTNRTGLPPTGTWVVVIDGAGRRTKAKRDHDSQLWTGLQNWHSQNNVVPGMRIKFRYDEKEPAIDGLPVIHLEVQDTPTIPQVAPTILAQVAEEAVEVDSNPELPLSLERQLEDFLASNLEMLEKGLQIYRDEEGREGRQYPTDVGEIDLLCNRLNRELLVVELKRGRSSDIVVGQISRYIGWVKHNIAKGCVVKGLILTYENDEKLRYAVAANPNIELKRFKLRLEIIPDEEL